MVKSLYLHIPFCAHICAYCDFFRFGYHEDLADRYLVALKDDLDTQVNNKELSSIYIGGGTPSVLSLFQLKNLMEMLNPYRSFVKEYTMEANVESLNVDKIKLIKEYGVNRISLGVQSLQDNLLNIIERKHSKQQIINVIDNLHQYGIDNISIDLIYGLPTQTLGMWKEDLASIVEEFNITHISLYALTIEKNSSFGRHNVKNIDPGLEADMYEYAIAYLSDHGFHHYEISSFAKGNHESMHNKAYWHYQDFYGVGCGASGKINHQRYEMVRNVDRYLHAKRIDEYIPLSIEDEMFEYIMMNLRLKSGLSYHHFEEMFHKSFNDIYGSVKDQLIQDGELSEDGDYLKTTMHGMLFLNDVLIKFINDK